MQSLSPDPVQALMRDPEMPAFLTRPVPVQGLPPSLARQILRDHVWKTYTSNLSNPDNTTSVTGGSAVS